MYVIIFHQFFSEYNKLRCSYSFLKSEYEAAQVRMGGRGGGRGWEGRRGSEME